MKRLTREKGFLEISNVTAQGCQNNRNTQKLLLGDYLGETGLNILRNYFGETVRDILKDDLKDDFRRGFECGCYNTQVVF